MKKLIIILAIALVSCSKDTDILPEYDCECETVYVYLDGGEGRTTPTEIRPCLLPESTEWGLTGSGETFLPWNESKAISTRAEHNCK